MIKDDIKALREVLERHNQFSVYDWYDHCPPERISRILDWCEARLKQDALDRMAVDARELGLHDEPVEISATFRVDITTPSLPNTHQMKMVPFDVASFENPPCYICGYNGRGYFQPDKHMCATIYHRARARDWR